jgi:hypothetical protein
LEKYFGSQGSFFQNKFVKGFYEFNPPFITTIIEKGVRKIFNDLEKSSFDLAFFITLPVWDKDGKKEIIEKELGKTESLNKIDYEDFNLMNEIKNSKFLKFIKIMPKNNFAYFDHYNIKFKSLSIQHSYIIILSNYELTNQLDIFNLINKKILFSNFI